MALQRFLGGIGALTVFVAILVAGTLIYSPRTHARDDNDDSGADGRIKRGFEIAPVPLNLTGKRRELVGLGSYLVNAVASCNDCHTADPTTLFEAGGNPFFGQPTKINPATYMGGGRDFGPVVPNSPDIISRNLTPDVSGKPEGGRSFSEFRQIMRTGIDLDHLHPTCSSTVTTGCLPPPFDGALLQIMPWYSYQYLTDLDLRAIYEYLSAIPCVAGPPAPNPLHNDCP
jgi:hypothetical protein